MLSAGRGGRVILDIGTFSEDDELVDDELTVVHVVVLFATVVLVGVGELEDSIRRRDSVAENISLCGGELALLRTITEPVDASCLSFCGRSLLRTVFADKTIVFEGAMILEWRTSISREYLAWFSIVKALHLGNPRKVFGNWTPSCFSTSSARPSTAMERSLDGSIR